eukprot:TRINITY_DN2269_c0_g1_i8.p1 TRINITY_DN2269_c0_g1~~TRINITY_DN2269_c0_g1_i8.p1  ORF type:complete len:333 (+),score=62.92 TRINITY_DN2269_c0_g1_i8:41-1039(+)
MEQFRMSHGPPGPMEGLKGMKNRQKSQVEVEVSEFSVEYFHEPQSSSQQTMTGDWRDDSSIPTLVRHNSMLPEVTDRSSPQRQRELYYGNNQFIAKTLNIKRMVVESAVLSEIVPTQPLFSVEVPREDFLVRAKYQVDASPTIEEEKDEFDENFQTPRKGNPRPRYDSVLSAKSSTKRRTIGELSARRETPRRRPHWFWDEYQSHQPLSASATFCLNKTDGIPYVVKSYTRSYVETFGPNFEHFVKFSTDNDNKYLAKYHHYFQDGDSSHLVREHCPKTLRAILDERPRVGEVMVRRVLRHVGKGLTALHSKHLFHLNLKPGLLSLIVVSNI